MKKQLSPSVAEPKASWKTVRVPVDKEAEVRGPVPGAIYTEAYVTTLAKFIYLWGWSMVNVHSRLALFCQIKELMYGPGGLTIAQHIVSFEKHSNSLEGLISDGNPNNNKVNKLSINSCWYQAQYHIQNH